MFPGAGGVELDPLVGADDTSRPLRSKLLAVPALRARYLKYVRDIAERWLDSTSKRFRTASKAVRTAPKAR
jgi:hypothetical protein